jgi:two-component system response regulator CpxR
VIDKIRVLFVDDEEELVSAVVERLELRDIEAHGVTSGAEALTKIEAQEFNVVVLDVRMPSLGGFDVLRRLKRAHPGTEVVLLSGHGSSQNVEEGLRLGAFDYLQKPVDIEYLIDIIRRATAKAGHGGRRG